MEAFHQVRVLLEIAQKTVIFKNLLEFCGNNQYCLTAFSPLFQLCLYPNTHHEIAQILEKKLWTDSACQKFSGKTHVGFANLSACRQL